MSGLESVVREQERMAKKQKLCRKQTLVDLEHVIKIVEATSEQLKAEGAYSHLKFIAETFEMRVMSALYYLMRNLIYTGCDVDSTNIITAHDLSCSQGQRDADGDR